jgi:hypothetical protein
MTEAEHARKARGDGDRTRGPYRPSRREQITYVSFSPENVDETGVSPRWTVWMPDHGRGDAANRANSEEGLVTAWGKQTRSPPDVGSAPDL